MQNMILDSKEKIELYRNKMQELVSNSYNCFHFILILY